VYGGVVSLSDCRVNGNEADDDGGGLYLSGGTINLSNGTLIRNNTATGDGANLRLAGGTATYTLPAPPGYWLDVDRCEVRRKGCTYFGSSDAGKPDADPPIPPGEGYNDYLACEAASDACAVNTTNLDGTLPCPPRAASQPCEWEVDPSLLGDYIYTLPSGSFDDAFPTACGAGYVGSSNSAEQTSFACAGLCPAGSQCPEPATTVPLPCDAGAYCPQGSAVPRLCSPGTWSNATTAVSQAHIAAQHRISRHSTA
jgi:hypothetical protein